MRGRTKNALLAAGAVIAFSALIAAVTNTPNPPPQKVPTHGIASVSTPHSSASPPPSQPSYTVSQQQAITAAEGYLSDGQGFSKAGLISQLSSQYGGFSKSLARFAVRHVSVSWNRQAVISAKAYVNDGQGFSYNSLVAQLESPYGGGPFTSAQATYAAHKVGLAP